MFSPLPLGVGGLASWFWGVSSPLQTLCGQFGTPSAPWALPVASHRACSRVAFLPVYSGVLCYLSLGQPAYGCSYVRLSHTTLLGSRWFAPGHVTCFTGLWLRVSSCLFAVRISMSAMWVTLLHSVCWHSALCGGGRKFVRFF